MNVQQQLVGPRVDAHLLDPVVRDNAPFGDVNPALSTQELHAYESGSRCFSRQTQLNNWLLLRDLTSRALGQCLAGGRKSDQRSCPNVKSLCHGHLLNQTACQRSRQWGRVVWRMSDGVLGAFHRVYNELGTGFLESVYEAAMVVVLEDMGMRTERQAPVSVYFRGTTVGSFRIDLLVESVIAVELKASRALDVAHEAQLLNYLRASDLEIALLLNFGQRPSFKRLAYSNRRKLRGRGRVDDVSRRTDADPTLHQIELKPPAR